MASIGIRLSISLRCTPMPPSTPGTPSRRSIQSVAGHLIGLYLVLDRGLNAKRATAMIREAIAQRGRFMWLEPPPSMGPLTVLDVAGATHLAGHVRLVELWANSVWDAWAEHHERFGIGR